MGFIGLRVGLTLGLGIWDVPNPEYFDKFDRTAVESKKGVYLSNTINEATP